MRHLLVTNDFPPKVGGIQTYLWELWRRLPPEEFAVLTTAHPDATAFDAAQPFRVERVSGTVLWPTPGLCRRIDRLAAELDAGFVVLDPALPLGAVGPQPGDRLDQDVGPLARHQPSDIHHQRTILREAKAAADGGTFLLRDRHEPLGVHAGRDRRDIEWRDSPAP